MTGLARVVAQDTQAADGSWVRAATEYDAKGAHQAHQPALLRGTRDDHMPVERANAEMDRGISTRCLRAKEDPTDAFKRSCGPDTSSTVFTYAGLVTTQTVNLLPEGTQEVTTTTKNLRGLAASVKDANNITTSYTYDAEGNLMQVAQPQSVNTTFTFDTPLRKTQSVVHGSRHGHMVLCL